MSGSVHTTRWSRRGLMVLAALAFLGGVMVGSENHARAVNTLLFAAPSPAGAGDCSGPDDPCTLPTAIGLSSDGFVVQLADGNYPDTAITIAHGIALQALGIRPSHPVLIGDGGTDDVIRITATNDVTISNIAITNTGDPATSGSVGIDNTSARLALSNVAISDNQTGLTTTSPQQTTLDQVTMSGNHAGISNNATLTMSDSTVSNSGDVGVINNPGAVATISRSTISANSLDGVRNSGVMSVASSMVANNVLTEITNLATGVLTVDDSTLFGGAFALRNSGTASAIRSTIAATSPVATGVVTLSGGVSTVGADIITGPQHACSGTGTITDLGYTIAPDVSCTLNGTGSATGVSSLLSSLVPPTDNGGPTDTLALQPWSPAIDFVTGRLSDGTLVCRTPDQRGAGRPAGSCDAGAFESAPPRFVPEVDLAVTPAGGSSLGRSMSLTAAVSGTGANPTGSVRFTADGGAIAGCGAVALSGGSAECDTSALAAGTYDLRAHYSGDLSYTAKADELPSYVVGKGATRSHLAIHSTSIVATVAPFAPATGTPTGTVSFTVDGIAAGTRELVNGKATLARTNSGAHGYAVTYSGDDQFQASSGSSATTNPTLTAAVTSSVAKTSFGWFRAPVTVTFTCNAGSSALLHPCPAPVFLATNKADQNVVRTINASDGGVATLTVGPINVDQVPPTVSVDPDVNGGTFPAVQTLTCVGHDTLSGIASCTITQHAGTGDTEHFTAFAKDEAGNTASVSGNYHVVP
jgi:hypothetical protein